MRIRPRLIKRREDQLGRLRAGYPVSTINDEEGNAGDADIARLGLVVANFSAERAAVEDIARGRSIEPNLGGEAHEDVGLADRLAFDEVPGHETLFQLVLLAELARVVDETVSVERVTGTRFVEVEIEPDGCGVGRDARLGRFGVGTAHPVLGSEALDGIAVARRRGIGIELEAAPDDIDVVAMRELRQRGFEAALADVAPGTDDVRPDFDVHRSTSIPAPMPSIQTSLLTAVPAGVGQMLPGLRIVGVRQYIVSNDPEKPVRTAPATLSGSSGVRRTAPTASSLAARMRRNFAAGMAFSNGKAFAAVPWSAVACCSVPCHLPHPAWRMNAPVARRSGARRKCNCTQTSVIQVARGTAWNFIRQFARQNVAVGSRAVIAGLGALYVGAFAVASLVLKTTPSDLDYFFWPASETVVSGHPLLVYSTPLTIVSVNDNGPLGIVPLVPVAAVANALHVAGNLRIRAALVDGVMALFILLLAYQAVHLITRARSGVTWPLAAAATVALAPAVWIGVLDYGHIEQPVELCLVLLAVEFALRKHAASTGIAVGAAVLARTVALFTAVPLVLIPLAAHRVRPAVIVALAAALTVVVGLAPFLIADHAAVVHSLVGFRGTLPIVGGSFWVLARGSLVSGVAQHWDAGIAAVLAVALVVITLVRRPATPATVAGLLGLLTVASCCLPLVAKTVFPYYLVEPSVLSTVWWLARPGSARNWRIAVPVLLNADVFITKAGTMVAGGTAWTIEGVVSSVLTALALALVTADLFRNSRAPTRV
jgi:hypothetical protein